MLKFILLMSSFLLSTASWSADDNPKGFLWYNLPVEKKEPEVPKSRGVPFNKLSYTMRDAVLRFYTMEALHRARQTKSLKDMKNFIALQDYWLKESSSFSNLFQKTMLYYPQYDFNVTHPTSSIGTKLNDERREKNREAVIHNLSKTQGLLFFYRGQNPYDQKQIPIIRDLCNRFNLPLIPVSVDGKVSELLGNTRLDSGHADALGVRFFPALLLVNPKTQKSLPVAYGLTTQDVLIQRLFDVATQFRGESI